MSEQQASNAQVSEDGRVVTIFGVRYAIELFRHLGIGPIGSRIQLLAREDGVVTLRKLDSDSPAPHLVPGVMRCAKCAFRLVRTARSGTFSAGDSKTEPCPNGCGPLWPETWEQRAREAISALRLLASVPAVRQAMNPSGLPHEGNCGCPWCVTQKVLAEAGRAA